MRWGFVADSLMASPVVVIINKARNSTLQCDHVILRVQIDIFSLNGPPKALYPDIVKAKVSAFDGFDAKFGYHLSGLSWKQSNSMNNKIGSKL